MTPSLPQSTAGRAARLTMGVIVLFVLIGCVCAATLMFARVSVQSLGHASLVHLQVWSQLADRFPILINGITKDTEVPAVFEVHEQEFVHLLGVEDMQRRKVEALVARLRSPLLRWLALIESSDLNQFRRSDVDPQLRSLVHEIMPSKLKEMSGDKRAFHYRALLIARGNGELLYPLTKRVAIASEMLERGVIPIYIILTMLALSVIGGIWLIWRTALRPALASTQQSAMELATQNILLLRVEDQLSAAQKTARLSYWFEDAGGSSITTVNMEQVLGREAATLPTTIEELASLSPPEEAAHALEAYRKLRHSDGPVEISRTISIPGKQSITVRERIEALTRSGNRRIMGTMLDISELTRANEQLAKHDKVTTIETIIRGIAHDFNNLLAIIQGNAELAKRAPEASRARIDSIIMAVRTAHSVIRQLQLTPSETVQDAELLSPIEYIRSVSDAMAHESGGGVRITIHDNTKSNSPHGEIKILVNRGLFHNAIINILKNAMEAKPDSEIDIKIFIANSRDLAKALSPRAFVDRQETNLCIEVSDRGPGMTNAVRMRVLEPFFSTKGSGRGVGLWSVYSFMKSCGGHLNIESVLNQGTSVQMYFPITTLTKPGVLPKESRPADTGRTRRILVIEDESRFSDVLLEQLSILGLDAILAKDANSAEAILRSGRSFAAVLADINLGGGRTGIELMLQIGPEMPTTKVILMSGVVSNWVRPSDGYGKHWLFLEKPFTFAALNRVLVDLGIINATDGEASTGNRQ